MPENVPELLFAPTTKAALELLEMNTSTCSPGLSAAATALAKRHAHLEAKSEGKQKLNLVTKMARSLDCANNIMAALKGRLIGS